MTFIISRLFANFVLILIDQRKLLSSSVLRITSWLILLNKDTKTRLKRTKPKRVYVIHFWIPFILNLLELQTYVVLKFRHKIQKCHQLNMLTRHYYFFSFRLLRFLWSQVSKVFKDYIWCTSRLKKLWY